MKKMLYVFRPLLNGEELIKWAKSNGFKTTIKPEEMHVTIAYSREKVEWEQFTPQNKNITINGGKRSLKRFDGGATVLLFESNILKDRWNEFKKGGASWDYPDYHSHVTLSYKADNLDVNSIEPYQGTLKFGPEEFKDLDLDYKETIEEV